MFHFNSKSDIYLTHLPFAELVAFVVTFILYNTLLPGNYFFLQQPYRS